MKVIVVGAGIVGSAIAFQLARSGAQVCLLGRDEGPATQATFGWVNASFFADEAHHRLRAAGLEAYARMAPSPFRRTGALWWEEQGDALVAFRTRLEGLGYAVAHLSAADVRAREPDVAQAPAEALAFSGEGVADAAVLLGALTQSDGVTRMIGVDVKRLMTRGGRAVGVCTTAGDMMADHVVVAAGVGAARLLQTVDLVLPMVFRPGANVVTKPVSARLGSVLVTPQGEVRQLPDGRLMSPAAANHQGDTTDQFPQGLEQIGQGVCARLAHLLGVSEVTLDEVRVANRPVPQDGLPVIGASGVDGLHVAVMHSGVTLAAITGEIVAAQVTGRQSNAQADLVAPYTLSRFQ